MTVQPNRRVRPEPGAPRPTTSPLFERHRRSEGLEILLAPRPQVPLVELELLLTQGGGSGNPPSRPGLANLTAALLDEGTKRYSGPELAALLERRGGALGSSAGWDATSIRLSLPAEELAFGLDLLAEIILDPTFPEQEFERLRRQSLTELARRFDQPASLADEAFTRTLFAGTPQAELLIGSAKSLAAISRDELVDFHRRNQKQIGARLVVTGDIREPIGDFVRRSVPEGLARSVDGSSVLSTPHPPEKLRAIVVDRPRAAQSELRVGHLGVSRRHPDRAGLGFLNAILGGKFTSRINLSLRERHGITYGVHSRFVDRRDAGPFVVSGAIENRGVGLAAREILAELHRLRDERVSAEEIAETRSYLIGIYPYGLQTIEGVAGRLRDIALHELPLDHVTRVLDEYRSIDAERLQKLAVDHFLPERCVLVAVGPGEELARQLEGLEGLEGLEIREPRAELDLAPD